MRKLGPKEYKAPQTSFKINKEEAEEEARRIRAFGSPETELQKMENMTFKTRKEYQWEYQKKKNAISGKNSVGAAASEVDAASQVPVVALNVMNAFA